MNKVTIIGAGKTGRGYLARLLRESDVAVTFIDENKERINELQNRKSFTVHFFGEVREPFTINGYTAVTWDEADLTDTDLILVSVGGTHLSNVGSKLSALLPKDRHIDIITCENSSKPAKVLGEAIGEGFDLSISESTVFCTTIEEDSDLLNILSENYPYLQCNADLLPGFVSDIPGIRPLANFGTFLTRKLYTYNAASCVLAYLGALKGYTDYRESGRDPEILEKLDQNYEMTNKVLCRRFGYDPKDQAEFAALSRAKFTSQVIADSIARNAREPHRKLGADERIIGPMKMIYESGSIPDVLIETAAAALLYKEDGKWDEITESRSPAQILEEICGLPKGSFLHEEILKTYFRLQVK